MTLCRAERVIGGSLYHILSAGQSLSQGGAGTPELTTTQPGTALMLSSRPDSYWPIPLTETEDGNGFEKPAAGIANAFETISGLRPIVTNHGGGGKSYLQLAKGTTYYAEGITQAIRTRVNVIPPATVTVACVDVIHGEEDSNNNETAAQYQTWMETWQSDYQSDLRALYGDASLAVPMVLDQVSSKADGFGVVKGPTLGQLQAAIDNPGVIYCVGPKYQYDYADVSHLVNTSYRRLGELHGKAIASIVAGSGWTPLRPLSAVRSGAAITVTFSVPVAPLAFDTTNVDERTNYGFEFYDDGGPSAAISSVALQGTTQVVVTLDGTPSGAGQEIRYAYTRSGTGSGAHDVTGLGGNLRDSDTTTIASGSNTPLYNWCVHFAMAVTT